MQKIEKAFNLSLAFLPVLGVYASFIPGISIGQLVLLICSGAVTVSKIRSKSFQINIPSLLFLVYIIISSGLSLFSAYVDNSIAIYTLVSQLLVFAFLFVGYNAFNKAYFSRIFIQLSIAIAVLSLLQYLVLVIFGKGILFIFPGVPLECGVSHEYLTEVMAYFSRIQGCFTEPAHLAQFLAIGMLLMLSKERQTIRDCFLVGLLLIVCLLTNSGNALMVIGLLGIVYIFYYIKEKKNLKVLGIIFAAGLVIAGILYISNDTVRSLFARITELTGTTGTVSSGYYRTRRGYELFAQFPLLYQLFGIGCGNIGAFCSFYNIQGQFFVDPAHGMYTYLNGIQFYLTATGIIGILLYAFMLLQGKGKSKVHTYSLCLLIGLSCIAALHGDVTWLILFLLILSDKAVCKEYTTTLHVVLEWVLKKAGKLFWQRTLKKGCVNNAISQNNTKNVREDTTSMNESDVLLSVVIPTYNRYQYLRGCVESILISESQSLEVIIQDNTADNSGILPFIENLNDSRVKYYHMAEHVTVSENCSNAVQNATGKYVCMLGDDDSICGSLMELAEQMDRHGIEAATYGIAMYHWPDLLEVRPDLDALISPKFEGRITHLVPKELLMKELRNGMQEVYALPRAYHAIVSKEVMEKVRQKTGTYFPGPSPDMANAVGCALYAKNQIHIDVPMIISGYSGASAGGQGRQGKHKGSLKNKSWLPADVEETWSPKIPKLWLGATIWPESALKALEACDCRHYSEKMNYGVIYAETLYQDHGSLKEISNCHVTAFDFCRMTTRIVKRISQKLYKVITKQQAPEICVKKSMSLLDAVNYQDNLNKNVNIEALFARVDK